MNKQVPTTMTERQTDVFLDTSVQIARVLRSDLKTLIENCVSRYRRKASGTIALQEFKKRVLKDAAYLLTKLNHTKSYTATLQYVTSVLPQRQHRKKTICLLLLHNILHDRSDDELSERARLYLRTLLVHGEKLFRRFVDEIVPPANCYLATLPVHEKKRYLSYSIETKCSKTKGKCQIGQFLRQKKEICRDLAEFLNRLPKERLTTEIERGCEFAARAANDAIADPGREEPCLRYGDLLLALESEGWPVFYTMNYKESQAFADFLGQDLVIRPNNPANEEQTYLKSARPWPVPLT